MYFCKTSRVLSAEASFTPMISMSFRVCSRRAFRHLGSNLASLYEVTMTLTLGLFMFFLLILQLVELGFEKVGFGIEFRN